MNKQRIHDILSSIQMSPRDKKDLVNYLNNFKNNQQQTSDEFIIKYYRGNIVDLNFDDLKIAVLNKNKIIIESNDIRINCSVTKSNENTIHILTDLLPFANFNNSDTEADELGLDGLKIIFTKDETEIIPINIKFSLYGDGNTFLSDDGSYKKIDITSLQTQITALEERIATLEGTTT